MLNIDLILKIKKKFKLSLGDCKKILEKNKWNYEKSIFFIKNKKINKIKKKFFNYFSILNIEKNNFIFIFKISFDSIIINDSTILEKLKEKLLKKINFNILKNEINFLSLKLKEIIFINNFFIFNKKNNYFYNHKNSFFCLINFKKKIVNICCHIIFNKIFFLKIKKCKYSLFKQKYIKNDNIFINDLININFINYSILINKNGIFFFYE